MNSAKMNSAQPDFANHPSFAGQQAFANHHVAVPGKRLAPVLTGVASLCFILFLTLLLTLPTLQPLSAQESANILARKGNAALARQENQQAVDFLSEALTAGTLPIYTRAAILNDRALAYTRLKKYELALKDYNSAIEQFPEYAIAYNNRGLLLQQMGFNKEAIEDFNRAIALQPQQGATFHNRANALNKAGAEKTAFRDYGRALSMLDDKSAPHLARGLIHAAHQRRYAALRELNLALENNQNHAKALYNRGKIHLALKESGEAIQDITKAVDLDPENISYQLTLAEIYLDKGQYRSARTLLNTILKAEPANTKAMIMRGRALTRLNLLDPALEDLDEAVALEGSANAYAERALIYARANMAELSAADMDTAIQKAPKTARSWVALGDAAQLAGLTSSAERYYREALKRDKKDEVAAAALQEMGILLDETNITDELEPKAVDEGWSIREEEARTFVAVNPRYNSLAIPLDLYGPNKPKILEWTVLNGAYKGFGLLRYDAGSKARKDAHEQVVVINLRKQKVLSIEPYRWGNKVAVWDWKKTELTVKDPEGISNTLILRKPIKRPPARVAEDRDWYDSGDGFWLSNPKQRPQKKKRTRVRKKKNKGLFGIFGF